MPKYAIAIIIFIFISSNDSISNNIDYNDYKNRNINIASVVCYR